MLGINFYFRWKVSTITSLKKYLINLYWCWLYLSYTLPYIYSNIYSNFWFKVNDIFNFVNVLIAVYFIEKGNNNKIKRMSSQTRNSMILKISTSCRNCYIYFDKVRGKTDTKISLHTRATDIISIMESRVVIQKYHRLSVPCCKYIHMWGNNT